MLFRDAVPALGTKVNMSYSLLVRIARLRPLDGTVAVVRSAAAGATVLFTAWNDGPDSTLVIVSFVRYRHTEVLQLEFRGGVKR